VTVLWPKARIKARAGVPELSVWRKTPLDNRPDDRTCGGIGERSISQNPDITG
jgi:hypothetical protein